MLKCIHVQKYMERCCRFRCRHPAWSYFHRNHQANRRHVQTHNNKQKTLAFLPGYYFAHKFLSIILTQKSMLNDDLATLSQVYLIPYSFVMKTSGISLLYLSPHPSLRSTIYPFRFFHFPLSDFVMGVYSKVCKKTNKSFLSLTVPIKIRQR